MNYKKERLGEKNKNHFGTEMQIVNYKDSSDIDVMFLDDFYYIVKHTTYVNFKRGNITNPYDPTVAGIGFEGNGKYLKYNNKIMNPSYMSWSSMINRCYARENDVAYYNVSSVSKEWFNFQNFANWYDENKYDVEGRLHLDKDILYPGNKIYSPSHCLLVPQRINMLFTNKKNKRGLPNGITKYKNTYYATYNFEELGHSSDLYKAYALYAKRKKETIVKIANEYKDIIPDKVYQALLNYEVRIENDKNYIRKN